MLQNSILEKYFGIKMDFDAKMKTDFEIVLPLKIMKNLVNTKMLILEAFLSDQKENHKIVTT